MNSTIHIPLDRNYTRDHEWLKREGEEYLTGITAFAARELGDIVFLDLPQPGTVYRQGEVFGTVEAVKTVSDLIMPVSGRITGINPLVLKTPELVNSAPYDEGWLVSITTFDSSGLDSLLSAIAYRDLIG
ncbi:glycine cleavage system protein GcvH [Mucilaginibacter sp. AW1-3]